MLIFEYRCYSVLIVCFYKCISLLSEVGMICCVVCYCLLITSRKKRLVKNIKLHSLFDKRSDNANVSLNALFCTHRPS